MGDMADHYEASDARAADTPPAGDEDVCTTCHGAGMVPTIPLPPSCGEALRECDACGGSGLDPNAEAIDDLFDRSGWPPLAPVAPAEEPAGRALDERVARALGWMWVGPEHVLPWLRPTAHGHVPAGNILDYSTDERGMLALWKELRDRFEVIIRTAPGEGVHVSLDRGVSGTQRHEAHADTVPHALALAAVAALEAGR